MRPNTGLAGGQTLPHHDPPMTSTSSAITTQLGQQGLGHQPWWVEQWMELINSYRYKKRLERAWSYVREGNVLSIRFEGRRVHARVQGTEEEPGKENADRVGPTQ